MTRSKADRAVVAARLKWIRQMLAGIRQLPVAEAREFFADPRNAAAAESYLRRALEALFDLGRHVLARELGIPADEYKEIARGLRDHGLVDADTGDLAIKMAGYRNRMVHFYNEITPEELREICAEHLDEIEAVAAAVARWLRSRRPSP